MSKVMTFCRFQFGRIISSLEITGKGDHCDWVQPVPHLQWDKISPCVNDTRDQFVPIGLLG